MASLCGTYRAFHSVPRHTTAWCGCPMTPGCGPCGVGRKTPGGRHGRHDAFSQPNQAVKSVATALWRLVSVVRGRHGRPAQAEAQPYKARGEVDGEAAARHGDGEAMPTSGPDDRTPDVVGQGRAQGEGQERRHEGESSLPGGSGQAPCRGRLRARPPWSPGRAGGGPVSSSRGRRRPGPPGGRPDHLSCRGG